MLVNDPSSTNDELKKSSVSTTRSQVHFGKIDIVPLESTSKQPDMIQPSRLSPTRSNLKPQSPIRSAPHTSEQLNTTENTLRTNNNNIRNLSSVNSSVNNPNNSVRSNRNYFPRSLTETIPSQSTLSNYTSPGLTLSRSSSVFEDLIRSERSRDFISLTPVTPRTREHHDSVKNEITCLMALFTSTNGKLWRTCKNWSRGIVLRDSVPQVDGTASVHDWHGVEVNANGNINEIRLLMNDLAGSIPDDFCGLSHLCYLDLSNNKLGGPIPTRISQLCNLRELKLHYNNLSGSIPNSIGDMISLRGLHLEGNSFSGSIPDAIGKLKYLVKLNIACSVLTGPIPSTIGMLENLQELKLNQNRLTGEIPASLGNLKELRVLFLQDNRLSGSIPPSLATLPMLQKLNLSNNPISGLLPKEFMKRPLSTELKLENTNISGPRSIVQLRRRAALRWAWRYIGYVLACVSALFAIYAYPFIPEWYVWLHTPIHFPPVFPQIIGIYSSLNKIKQQSSRLVDRVTEEGVANMINKLNWKSANTNTYIDVERFLTTSCNIVQSESISKAIVDSLGVQQLSDLFFLKVSDMTEYLHLSIIQQRKLISCVCKLYFKEQGISGEDRIETAGDDIADNIAYEDSKDLVVGESSNRLESSQYVINACNAEWGNQLKPKYF